jgi:hypothetical protein
MKLPFFKTELMGNFHVAAEHLGDISHYILLLCKSASPHVQVVNTRVYNHFTSIVCRKGKPSSTTNCA